MLQAIQIMTQQTASSLMPTGLPPSGQNINKAGKPPRGVDGKQRTQAEFPDIMNKSLSQMPNPQRPSGSARRRTITQNEDGISEIDLKSSRNQTDDKFSQSFVKQRMNSN